MQHFAAEEVERKYGQERQAGAQDGSAERLVDALVHDGAQIGLAHRLQVFADTVEDDDRIVHRVTDERKDRGHYRQRDLLVGQREGADGDQRVVEDGDDGCCAVDQLKAEPEVDQHACERPQDGPTGLPRELLARGGSNDVGLLYTEGRIFVVAGQRCFNGLTRGVVVGVRHLGDRDHLFVRLRAHVAADALDAEVLYVGLVQGRTKVILIRRRGEGDVDQRAALEVHAARYAVPEEHA